MRNDVEEPLLFGNRRSLVLFPLPGEVFIETLGPIGAAFRFCEPKRFLGRKFANALSGLPERDGRVLSDRDPLALAVDGPEDDEGFGAFANPEPKPRGEGVAVLDLAANGRL
jgi:hypothetical protein